MNAALLAGINKYQTPGNDLQGCLNDVENMRSLLIKNCGFSVLQICTLVNEQATKLSIIEHLIMMIKQALPGDHLVFHFSGHGAQVPDTLGDESDHLTEILCPYDFDWRSDRYITDDELHDVCAMLDTGATLDIILDSCHSGTMLRIPGDGVARFIPYPFSLPSRDTDPTVTRILQNHGFPNVALWAGCRNDQTSADAYIGRVHQGAMTWAFTSTLSSRIIGQLARWEWRKNFIRILAIKLSDKGYDQVPQLETSDALERKEVFT